MKVHYICCAQSSSLDSKTNQLSLFHVLDEIGGAAFPLVLPNLCVASLFEREPEDGPLQSFNLAVALDGTLLASFTMSVDFSKSRRNRTVNTIQGLSIPATGTVTVSLLQKSRVLAEWQALAVQTGAVGVGQAAKPAAVERRAANPKGALAVN